MQRDTAEAISSRAPERGSVAFLVGLASALALLVVLTLLVASRESFSRDDFGFLLHVQKPVWSWIDLYLPLEQRWWWAYRPLGMDTYFYVCYQLFGLNSLGYFSVSIALHVSTSILVYRLATQLGFEPRIAMVTALLAISRHPSISGIYYGSVFHYVAAVFFSLLATSLFLDYARRRASRFRVASCMALILALLCNEFPIVMPALWVVLSLWASSTGPDGHLSPGAFPPSPGALIRAARDVGPALAVAGLYLVFRFGVIAPSVFPGSYLKLKNFTFEHLLGNLQTQIFYVFGSRETLIVACLLLLAVAARLVATREGRAILPWLLPVTSICAIWIVGALTPFLGIKFTHPRFSTAVEAPVCLLFGGYLSALWRLYGRNHPKVLELALVLLVFAALPYQTLWDRSHSLYGAQALNLVEVIRESHPDIESGSEVVILYNAPGLAHGRRANRFRSDSAGGRVALAVYLPEKKLDVSFHNLRRSPVSASCEDCTYLQLLPSLELMPAERRYLELQPPPRESP